MRCLLIISLFVLAGHRVESSEPDPLSGIPTVEKCEPGTHWKNDCNFCYCVDSDVSLCTLMLCNGDKEDRKKSILPSDKYCLPGSSWKSQCNYCTCTDNGMAMCTLKACDIKKYGPPKFCAPNTTWKSDCNTCWCTNIGLPACTLMACNDDPGSE